MSSTKAAVAVAKLGRAERNKRDKRDRLTRAARHLFQTKGFEATTTSEIADLADVAKGTLFFHAKSKEALLVMIFQEEQERVIERAFSRVPKGRLLDQLLHVFGVMLRHNQRNLSLGRVFAKELAFVRGKYHGIDAVLEAIFKRLGGLIESAKDRREIARDVDAELLSHNLFALYFVFMMRWLGSGEPSPAMRKPALRDILELHLRAVAR
jgi:AcrR family transcriptional regulator